MHRVASTSKYRAFKQTLALAVLAGLAAMPAHAQYSFVRAFGGGAGSFKQPENVAIDSSGNVFVLDSGNSRVQKFDNTGNFISTFGSSGSGNGQIAMSSLGLGTDGSNIFVADDANSRVQKFDNSGTYVTQFGTMGNANGQFSAPTDVTVNGSNIFVVDNNNNRVQLFTSSGVGGNTIAFKSIIGSNGTGDGQFQFPFRIAVNNTTGNIYVTDPNNGFVSGGLDRIEEFDPDARGNYQFKRNITFTDSTGTFNPNGIAVDQRTGNLFVADFSHNRVIQLDSAGGYLTQFGTTGSDDGQFMGADGVAVDTSGNVFVTDLNNNRVEEFAIAAVPETGTLLMLAGMTAGGLVAVKRKKKQAVKA